MLLRVALGLFVVSLLAAPASAQFATSDLAGDWTIHALGVGRAPTAPSAWVAGAVRFDVSGTVVSGDTDVVDYYGDGVPLAPGSLAVGAGGEVTGRLGDVSFTGQFAPGQGAAFKSVIVGVARSGAGASEETAAFFILIRPTGVFSQSDATGTWRVSNLQVPAFNTTASEYVSGRLIVSSEGEITGGSLTSSNGSTTTFVDGNLFVLQGGDGFFNGTLVTSPFGNESSAFFGYLTADKGVMVGLITRRLDSQIRLGMLVLQREPSVQYITADLAGQWKLFSVQSEEDPTVSGVGLSGRITLDTNGNVVSGTLTTTDGSAIDVPDGFLLIDNAGLVSGSLFADFGTIAVQATMLPAKNQIYGVDRLTGDFDPLLGLFTMVKAGPTAPVSTVLFRAGNVTVPEGTAATFFVDRSGATTTAVTVTYTATPVNAVPGQDYTPVSGILSFPAGATSRSFTVPTVANTRLDGSRSVLLSLGAPINGAMLGRDTSVLTILDNDRPGTVRLSAATYSVLESVANLVVTILRAGTNLAGNVSVMLTTQDGSAEAGDDYGSVETRVTFDANQTVRTVTIPIVNDTLAEGSETFVIRLSDPSPGVTLGTPATATATITDNDVAGTLRFEKATYSVTEDGGSVVLKVLRSGGLASGVTVRFTTMDGGACGECGDYAEQDGTLSFGAGNTSATITIPIGQDQRAEGNETFTVVLSNPQGGAALVAPSVATVTIIDDELAFQLSAGAYAIKEGPVNAVVTIERSGALVTPASVTFTASPGTAVAGLDFTPVSTVVAFPVNTRTRTVNVPIRNNTLVQGNRTVMLELSGPTGGAQLGTRATGVLTIQEDDQPGVFRLSAPTYSAGEKAGSLLVNILRAGTNLAGNVSVSFATGNGSATAGLDYTATAGTVTFGATETMKSFRIPILDDALVEGNETIPVTIFGPTSGATLGTPASAVITVVDDDRGGLVRFSAATYAFTEGAGNASITVVRTGGTASDVLVDYTFQDVTATSGGDYGAVSGTLSFGANQLSATILLPIFQDLQVEGNETLKITLGNVRGGAALVAPFAATVTIVDDESAIQFQRPDFTGREGTPAVITVVRTGALTTPASVTFTALPGTAAAGLDFTPVSTVLTFPANTPTTIVNVPLRNNALVQGNRTVLLALGAPTGGARLGPNATAVLTALDEDQGGVIRLSTGAYVVNEASGSLLVDIVRAGTNLAGNVSVDFATVDGTARANVSYLARIGTVVFSAGETKKMVSIPLVNDTVVRGPLSFSFVLSRPTGGASLGTPSSATIAVADNDLGGTVRLSGSAFQTIEGNGNFSVMVVRSGGAASEVAVDYTISHVSANGGDVAATTGTVTFAANQTTAAILIPILEDATSESNETFTVTLGNARGGAVLGAPFSATVTIVDDEVMIQFTGKFQGNQPEVSRTGPLGGSASVQYTTSSGSAILGQDFALAERGTLVFPPNQAVVLLPLTIIADNLAEGPETFTVTLRDPAAPAQLGPNFQQMFTIQDSNFGGRVQFGAPEYSGQEGQTVTLTVRRDSGAGTVLPVSWSLIGGNASQNDFAPAGGVLTFAPTETSKTLAITLTADALVEGPETATLALGVAPGAGELGPNAVTQLRIGDVAPTTVFQFASATAPVLEGDTASIVVTRAGDLSQAASIEYVTSPGTATLGDDYALVGGSITFSPGAGSVTIMSGTNVDQITESPETFIITLQNPSANAAIGTPSTVVVTITDPRPVGYTFALVAQAGVGQVRNLGGLPTVNNAGLVAFRSNIVDDSLPAIMTAAAGGPPTIVTTTADEDFDSFGDPVIADSGMVAFRAFLNGGGSAVYRAAGDGSSRDPVARPDAVYNGFGNPSVSRGGRISFRASLFDGEEESIVAGVLGGGLFTVTSDADGIFAGYGQTTAPGDLDSHVAFVASERDGGSGVYLSNSDGEEGIITRIVDGSEFDALNQYVTINNQGQVAFLGFPVGGGSGIFVSRNGSALTTIAATGAVFDSFGAEDGDGTPSINDAGAVAFYATLTDGGGGIFTGAG